MKKVLLIALFGATCVATPAFAADQDVVTLEDVVAEALQAAPTPSAAPARQAPAPRPATAAAPAQAPAPPAATPAPPTPPFPPQPAPLRPTANVRFDVTITDTGGAKPVTKTLSLTVTPGNNNASIRSSARPTPDATGQVQIVGPGPFIQPGSVNLNVDVRAVSWVETNAVRANVTVEYQPYVPDAKVQPGAVTASATSAFFDGRRTQILSTADPISDRKTTIEVTATILK